MVYWETQTTKGTKMETLPSPEGSIMDLYYISTFIIEAFWSGWWQGQLVTSQYLGQIQSISGVHMVPTLHRMLFYSWETLVSTDLNGNFTKSSSKAGEDFGHGTIGFCGAIPISMAKPQSLWINVGCFSCFPPFVFVWFQIDKVIFHLGKCQKCAYYTPIWAVFEPASRSFILPG